MPNHVDTILKVEGPDEEIQKFMDTCIVTINQTDWEGNDKKDDEGNILTQEVFDFGTIIPFPKELENTRSPAYTERDYRKAVERNAPRSELDEIMVSIGASKKCKEETGYDNWYDFKCAEWGTKWGAYDYVETDRAKGLLVFRYNTAWSPGVPVISKLGEMFPELHFVNNYLDEGWCYYGSHEVWGKHNIDDVGDNKCDGPGFMNFANDLFGCVLSRCKECGEIYDLSWAGYHDEETDDEICESCHDKQVEDKEEQTRRDEKNGLYPEKEDVAN